MTITGSSSDHMCTWLALCMIITHASVAVCACVYMGDVVCVIIDTINYADINQLECTIL